MVVTLIAGLRDNSRLVQKFCGVKSSQDTLLLAHIVDRLTLLLKGISGDRTPFESMVEMVSGVENNPEKNVVSFKTGADFDAMWAEINRG